MHRNIEPIVNDGFDGQHAKRVLNYIQSQREKEKTVLAQGHDRSEIARGIHETICRRSAAMLRRVHVEGKIAFFGGVAMNPCVNEILRREIDRDMFVPEDPQIVGSLGCAYITTTKES